MKKLTSMSFWVELYPDVSADPRYDAMLGQGGKYCYSISNILIIFLVGYFFTIYHHRGLVVSNNDCQSIVWGFKPQ